jgi:glycosyltransferase involved in cell wall biosynthesis
MKIVFITDWFSEKMGYAENFLPKVMAAMGHDVHVITSTAQVYFIYPFYKDVYEPFLGPPFVEAGEKKNDGYTLHRLKFKLKNNEIIIHRLGRLLIKLKPDIVQCFDIAGRSTYIAAKTKLRSKYKLFTGCHFVASIHPEAQENAWKINNIISYKSFVVFNSLILLFKSLMKGYGLKESIRFAKKIFAISETKLCYAVTIDAADIAVRFLGMPPAKIRVSELGVDTSLFFPAKSNEELLERNNLREKYGFAEFDIVCIYSGRFTEQKNAMALAQAIVQLRKKDKKFKAVFVGGGVQEAELKKMEGCQVLAFVPVGELPKLYRMADVGVWPMEESTSIMDAAACGLPVIISDNIQAEGLRSYSLVYKKNDIADLANKILSLRDLSYRRELSKKGINVILSNNNWIEIAKKRIEEYRQ